MTTGRADRYYGDMAARYDKQREPQETRIREHEVIARIPMEGPVLDFPVGTGAFLGHIKHLGVIGCDISSEMLEFARAKHPDVPLVRANVFDGLPFADKQFETVMCIRMVHNQTFDESMKIMRELRRVGKKLVVSVHLSGTPGRASTLPLVEKILAPYQIHVQTHVHEDWWVMEAW